MRRPGLPETSDSDFPGYDVEPPPRVMLTEAELQAYFAVNPAYAALFERVRVIREEAVRQMMSDDSPSNQD